MTLLCHLGLVMRISVVMVVWVLGMSCAQAQYRCGDGGKTTYSDVPCGSKAQAVGALQDNLTNEQRLGRARVSASESQQLKAIEKEKAKDDRRQQHYVEAVAAQDRAEQRRKAAKCNHALQEKQAADRHVARYQDKGWQNSLNQAHKERESAANAVHNSCD